MRLKHDKKITGYRMKKTGAWLARYALEQLPIGYTFGIKVIKPESDAAQ